MTGRWLSGSVILLLVILYSCTVEEGVPIAVEQNVGTLLIYANKDSAQIYLDGEFTGQMTSATEGVLLDNISAGIHVVQVVLEGFYADPDTVEVRKGEQTVVTFTLVAVQLTGSLEVTTEPDSVYILLDHRFVGYSPLRLDNIPVGEHTLEFRKSNHLPGLQEVTVYADSMVSVHLPLTLIRSVLVEHFSNSDCVPCVEADSVLENLLIQLGEVAAISVGYHPPVPSSADPMYNEARADNDARKAYYNIFVAPTIYIDGVYPIGGTLNLRQRLQDAIGNRSVVAPPAMVEIFDFQVAATAITGRVRVEARQDFPPDVVLRIAIIEREVVYTTPPGVNGQVRFFDVFRGFHPSPEGISIALTAGEHRFINFSVPTNPIWHLDQIQVVAFLQQESTKEVLQAAWSVYP